MEHTFLVKPGAWDARGTFRDAAAESADASGEVLVVHERDAWVNNAIIRIQTEPAMEIRGRYVIRPLHALEIITTWTCEHSVFGSLYGTLLFADRRIVSAFASGDGEYSGFENFELQDDGRYLADAALMRGKRRAYSWRLTLTRRGP